MFPHIFVHVDLLPRHHLYYGKMSLMKSKYLISTFFIIFPLLYSTAFAYKSETVHGKVMQVKDGDTVVIQPEEGGRFFTCRLYGLDAPETTHPRVGKQGQPYGEEASRELKRLILGQNVQVETTGAKTYNREVCIIKKDGTDINLEMVRKGYNI